MPPAFISYATSDRKRAIAICEATEQRGIRCWISCRDVAPGENYQEAIVQAIRQAPAMVLIFSEAANRSEEIKKELSLGSRYRIPVLALRIEDVEPSDAFAYELSTRQWIDAFEGWDKSLDALTARLSQFSVPVRNDSQTGQHPRPRHFAITGFSRRNRMIAASILLILIAAATATLFFHGLGSNRQVSLAVLPFADLSPARDKAYFAEGLAEEIQSSLGAEKGIKVLGRTSASEIKRIGDPQAVRTSLGVTHLLEGSARTAGDDLRVNVRLIDTKDGNQLWEHEYRSRLSDVFKVQDQIASAVVTRLRGTLVNKTVSASTPTAIDAYETYLAARALTREPNKQSLTRALKMARGIIDAHPEYAPGQALYADVISNLADGPFSYGDIPPDKARRIAFAHATEAIRLAPDKADGYAALGLAVPLPDAVKAYEKALALDPSRVYVRGRLAIALSQLKRNDEAFDQYRNAADMDPLSSTIINRYAQALAASGKADEATRVIDQFVHRTGMVAQGWRFRGNTYRYLGKEAQHIAARRRALQLDPKLPYQHEWLARALYLLGLKDQAAKLRPAISSYFQLFTADERDGLKQLVAQDGPRAWLTNGVEPAVFSLARAHDWAALVRFYDVRPVDYRDVCVTAPRFAPFLILALQKKGRAGEAQRLLDCSQRDIRSELEQRYRSPDDYPGEVEEVQASLLALRNDLRALDWLDRAVQRGWLGQYYSSKLSDWPQFDAFRTNPRYAAIQQRLDARIDRERTAVLEPR